MEVITIEKEAYYKLLREFAVMVKKAAENGSKAKVVGEFKNGLI